MWEQKITELYFCIKQITVNNDTVVKRVGYGSHRTTDQESLST